MPPLVYFVRHGQTAWNAEFRLQGQADTDMTELGYRQAERNGRRLADLIADPSAFRFVASPLRRTRETMERVRLALGLPATGYATDPRLLEVHFGDWQGHTFAELEAVSPGVSAARMADKWHFLPPGQGAESYEMLCGRVRSWLEEVEAPTVCVTHGGVVRAIFRLVAGIDADDAAGLEVPQDRVLRLAKGRLEWL